MAFPSSFLDELTERSDIVDVVSDYVTLKKQGSNMFGLCPFHSEKTSSFSVNEARQIFHCFGCGVGGGVISFIMRIENLDFPDAVRFLAARAGMTVPEDGGEAESRRRARLLELNKLAARKFYEQLNGEDGAAARDYLERRGVSQRTARRFGLGWAPDSWNWLTDSISGYEKSEFVDAGLAIANKSGGVYARMRGRVIFPIIDLRGNVIGFGGRVLDNSTPKYINSPETAVYSKSRNLFAMNIAKATKEPRLILAEGYMDVVSLHQAGFDCAVASLGTSLTDAQARLMKKYRDEVVIAYDMDAAGRGAADRAISLLDKAGLRVKLLELPGAKDPDEFIRKFGADALRERLDRSSGHIEYSIARLKTQYDLTDREDRVSFTKEGVKLIGAIQNAIEREVYAAQVAELGGVQKSVVLEEAERLAKQERGKQRREQRRKDTDPARAVQPDIRGQRYDNLRSAVAEEGIVALCYDAPELTGKVRERLTAADFSAPILAEIFTALCKLYDEDRHVSTLEEYLSQDAMKHLSKLLMSRDHGTQDTLDDYINAVKNEAARRSVSGDLMGEWERQKRNKNTGVS